MTLVSGLTYIYTHRAPKVIVYLSSDTKLCRPKTRGSVDYLSTRGIQVEVGLPDATLENRAESPLYGELYPKTVPAYTCPKQSNICNIYPNMSKNASLAHKPILIKSIIITILQLSPNNSIVDYTFILYKHILKSTILIHVMSKDHQATNRLLQNQPQNELSPRALSVPKK